MNLYLPYLVDWLQHPPCIGPIQWLAHDVEYQEDSSVQQIWELVILGKELSLGIKEFHSILDFTQKIVLLLNLEASSSA